MKDLDEAIRSVERLLQAIDDWSVEQGVRSNRELLQFNCLRYLLESSVQYSYSVLDAARRQNVISAMGAFRSIMENYWYAYSFATGDKDCLEWADVSYARIFKDLSDSKSRQMSTDPVLAGQYLTYLRVWNSDESGKSRDFDKPSKYAGHTMLSDILKKVAVDCELWYSVCSGFVHPTFKGPTVADLDFEWVHLLVKMERYLELHWSFVLSSVALNDVWIRFGGRDADVDWDMVLTDAQVVDDVDKGFRRAVEMLWERWTIDLELSP